MRCLWSINERLRSDGSRGEDMPPPDTTWMDELVALAMRDAESQADALARMDAERDQVF